MLLSVQASINWYVKLYWSYRSINSTEIHKENKTVFMVGDFNINLLKYQSHSETNDFINVMVSHYLLPISCIQQGLQTTLLQ